MYTNGISLNASSYKNLFTSASGQLYVPVKPSSVIYSQFDYVHGVSAGADGKGVPVNRIRILNSLIHQLMSMKKQGAPSALNEEELSDLSEEQKDALIKNYQQQIKDALASGSQPATYGFAGLMPETGSVINVQA